jgi:predicted Ser/Thr protein kinase
MAERKVCPRCGKEQAADAPEGLCPQCLLEVGLQSQSQAPASTASAQSGGFTPPTPQELNVLFQQLDFLELLGTGGMGAVYKARQKSLDRLIAVKILPPEVGLDPAFAERFTREARALAKLNHPHIVSVHDFGQVGGLYYFIMEYVDGVNLRQAMRAKQLRPAEALQIVPQICDALQYAHEEGVVHRDIKPENILLDKRGRVKIADFGLAKLLGKSIEELSLTGTRQIVGTVPYMAPEQIEGAKDIDHRADIYSLGVTFYEMLTGELPLGRFPPPSHKVEIDVRIDDVVLRTLEKAPELRYQQAGHVKAEMETISRTPRGRPIGAVLKDAAVQVMAGGKKAADWVADRMSGTGAGVKQAAEAFAEKHLPGPEAGEDRRAALWLWFLIALAAVGLLLDLARPRFGPTGTIVGIIPLVLVALLQRKKPTGRRARNFAIGFIVVGLIVHLVLNEPEAAFITVIVCVLAYLIWDRLWSRRAAPKETAPVFSGEPEATAAPSPPAPR